MKHEALAQFTATGSASINGITNLLEKYGIDYLIMNEEGTGLLQTRSCDIVIMKPANAATMTPDRLYSFMMKFDDMVRIGKETHSLTPAQIDLAKSCDKATLLKCLDSMWYSAKVAYTKVIAMLAQAYAIANQKPDEEPNSGTGNPVFDNVVEIFFGGKLTEDQFKNLPDDVAANFEKFMNSTGYKFVSKEDKNEIKEEKS